MAESQPAHVVQRHLETENHGLTLRGTAYLPPSIEAGKRAPTVLMLHGFTGNRIESGFFFTQIGRALAARGVAAVAFDFRHSGESDGSFDQMLISGELDDALRLTDWLGGQPFVDRSRLGLLGFSLGGLLASAVVARRSVYRALTLIAPTTVHNICRFARERERDGVVSIGPHTLAPDFFDDVRGLNPVVDGTVHPGPTLLVQGEADPTVVPDIAMAYAEARRRAGRPIEVERIPDADHVFNRPEPRARAIDRIAAWNATQLLH